MNCLFRDQQIGGIGGFLKWPFAGSRIRATKSHQRGVNPTCMYVAVTADTTTQTTQFHMGRSIIVR
ncbi:MAG: hypothetical protein RL518_1417 [Pseudomonadota bacterium]|jgi:hypothetical protein